jgi:AcrR family transcriptional regulator
MQLSKTPRRRDALATRERLVRAALDLFTTAGYLATTTLDIAAQASTAEATIYRHFSGKDALFNEAYREAFRVGIALLQPLESDRGLPVRDRLQRLARRLVERAGKDAAIVTMLLHRINPRALDEQSVALTREFKDGLTQIVASGKQEGSIRAGSAELWSAVWLALVTFAVDRVTAREWSVDHPSIGQTLDAAWSAIGYRMDRPPEPG